MQKTKLLPLSTRLMTFKLSPSYLVKGYLPDDAETRQELRMLLLSYTSKNARFAALKSVTYGFYLCPRAHRLGLHKARSYLELMVGKQLLDYLRKYNSWIGYGWSKDFALPANKLLRRKFLEAVTEGRTEFTMKVPAKLIWESEHASIN